MLHRIFLILLACSGLAQGSPVYGPPKDTPVTFNEVFRVELVGANLKDKVDFAGQYSISSDFRFMLPTRPNAKVTFFDAKGKTGVEIAAKIREHLAKQPTLKTVEFRIRQHAFSNEKPWDPNDWIRVEGQVQRVGVIPFRKGMTLFEAVQMAGGETEFGDISKVQVERGEQKKVYNLRVKANRMVNTNSRNSLVIST